MATSVVCTYVIGGFVSILQSPAVVQQNAYRIWSFGIMREYPALKMHFEVQKLYDADKVSQLQTGIQY